MKRTTIVLPPDLKARAERAARDEGRSFADVVRESVERYVSAREAAVGGDPLLDDDAVFDGDTPSDLAASHDAYLYDDAS